MKLKQTLINKLDSFSFKKYTQMQNYNNIYDVYIMDGAAGNCYNIFCMKPSSSNSIDRLIQFFTPR